MTRWLLSCAVIGLVAALYYKVTDFLSLPQENKFRAPEKTEWKPSGLPPARESQGFNDFSILPVPDGFHTMHVTTSNDDTIWGVGAPVFELAWTVEEDFYVPEGPTADSDGNLYFSPLNPREDVSLVAIDGETGQRRWSLPGRGPAYGAPLILNDPEHPGAQVIYHSTFNHAYAVRTNGTVLWKVRTNLVSRNPSRLTPTGEMHMWGMSYHPPTDSVIGLSLDGIVFALDRKSGKPVGQALQLPCDPAKPSGDARPNRLIVALGNRATDKRFGKLQDGSSVFERIIETVFGGGSCVSNFYAVDPQSGTILIAAAAADADDGLLDGFAADGALYKLSFRPSQQGGSPVFTIQGRTRFPGGTGATPSLTPDGKRVILSDENNQVLAVDVESMEVMWRVDVGEQIAASIAVTSDGGEMYAVTKSNIFKIVESSPREAEIRWRADLSSVCSERGVLSVNALTPTVVANGVAVSVALVRMLGSDKQLMFKVGIALLDRDTGKVRYFAAGREDSIAITGVLPDGGYYTGNSPVRRAVTTELTGNVPPLTGGVSRYRVLRHDLVVRDAACAASSRLGNVIRYLGGAEPGSKAVGNAAARDILMTRTLLRQSQRALAHSTGNLSASQLSHVSAALSAAAACDGRAPALLAQAHCLLDAFRDACDVFPTQP